MNTHAKTPFTGRQTDYMYGWDSKHEFATLGCSYIHSNQFHIAGRTGLLDPIARLICRMAGSMMHFEVWKKDGGFPSLNWHGQYTYGTSWFRGCKVWLTPAAGFVMLLPFRNAHYDIVFDDERCVTDSTETVKYVCETVSREFDKFIHSETPYDTHRLPFRMNKPTDLSDLLWDMYAQPPFHSLNLAKEILWRQIDTANRAQDRNMHVPPMSVYAVDRGSHTHSRNRGDSREGIDAPHIVAIAHLSAVLEELRAVERWGGRQGIKFEYL